jgi:hypothetical protein
MYLFFNFVSVASIPANVLLLPLGSLSAVTSFIAVIRANAGALGKLVFLLDGELNKVMISVVRLFAQSRYSVVPMGKYLGIILAFVLIIIAVCFILNNKKLLKYTAVISVCIIVLYQGTVAFQSENSAEVYITKSGACAVTCSGETLVIGIRNKNDYYSVSDFIKNKDGVSLLVTYDGKDVLTETFVEEHRCEKVISYTFSSSVFSNTNNYVRDTDCTDILADNFTVSLHHTDMGYSYFINIDGITVSDGYADADITVNDKTIYDKNGCIDLSEGNVIYAINKNYSARRVEIWQN